jgi:hypothetical protein
VAAVLERRPQLRGLGLGPHLEAGQDRPRCTASFAPSGIPHQRCADHRRSKSEIQPRI